MERSCERFLNFRNSSGSPRRACWKRRATAHSKKVGNDFLALEESVYNAVGSF